MSNPTPEQPHVFIDGKPLGTEIASDAVAEGLGRREVVDRILDIRDELSQRVEELTETAILLTDGEVFVPFTTLENDLEAVSEQPVTNETPKKLYGSCARIPLRETVDFVPPTQEQLESEVRSAFSDSYLKSISAGINFGNDTDEEVIDAYELDFAQSNADPTVEAFDVWKDFFANVIGNDYTIKTGADLDKGVDRVYNEWDLREAAIEFIESKRGKGPLSRELRVIAEYFGLKRLNETDFVKITGEMAQTLRDTQIAIDKGDYSKIDPSTSIVRNYLRGNGIALRKVRGGWEIIGRIEETQEAK